MISPKFYCRSPKEPSLELLRGVPFSLAQNVLTLQFEKDSLWISWKKGQDILKLYKSEVTALFNWLEENKTPPPFCSSCRKYEKTKDCSR